MSIERAFFSCCSGRSLEGMQPVTRARRYKRLSQNRRAEASRVPL